MKELWKTKHGRAENINLVNDIKWMCGEEREDGNRLELQVHLTSTLRNSYDQWSQDFLGHFFASVYWVGLWIVPGYGQHSLIAAGPTTEDLTLIVRR